MRFSLLFFCAAFIFSSCDKDTITSSEEYDCAFDFQDSSGVHPKNEMYQTILNKSQQKGLVGVSVMISDDDGLWLGSAGKADLASNIDVKPCNRFLIASISKVFTATAVFALIDEGVLTLDDPLNKWIPKGIADRIENANAVNLKDLLAHTSGIADYYTHQFELDRINVEDNHWNQEDILAYVYDKGATHPPGETYYYSNTNFLLLGMVLERATGKSLKEVYEQTIFSPLHLESAYFGTTIPIPSGTVKGYLEVNGNFTDSKNLYQDELGTGDGGIAINAYDLGVFIEQLNSGQLVSQSSLAQMKKWSDLPAIWLDNDLGHFQNGLGLEHYSTDYGNAIGHTGGIDGFKSIVLYFPDSNRTMVVLINSVSSSAEPRLELIRELVDALFT